MIPPTLKSSTTVGLGLTLQMTFSLLRSRLTSGVLNPVSLTDERFRGTLRLLPRKVQVEEYNDQCLQKLATTSTVYDYKAEHAILESRFLPAGVSSGSVPEHLIPKEGSDCAGLFSTLTLATGAQVMLIRHIMCEDGLVNGARRMVVGFNWPDGAQHQSEPGALPDSVLVKFHDARVGRIHRVRVPDAPEVEAVAIKPVSARFYGRQGVTFQRVCNCRYFPAGQLPYTKFKGFP